MYVIFIFSSLIFVRSHVFLKILYMRPARCVTMAFFLASFSSFLGLSWVSLTSNCLNCHLGSEPERVVDFVTYLYWFWRIYAFLKIILSNVYVLSSAFFYYSFRPWYFIISYMIPKCFKFFIQWVTFNLKICLKWFWALVMK